MTQAGFVVEALTTNIQKKTNISKRKYSRTPVTRTLNTNEKHFELARARVIEVDWKICFAMLKIDSYLFLSTFVYGDVQIYLFYQKR